MKKHISEEYQNPVRARFVAQYNAMTEEQQRQFDAIDSLAKEQKYLKPIKRVRKPNISAGTIFAMRLPEDIYVYGKIIARADKLPNIYDGFFVALVSRIATRSMEERNFDLTEAGILTEPWIVSDRAWRNGRFFTVFDGEVSKKEKKLDIGFYQPDFRPQSDGALLPLRGHIFDINGSVIDREPEHLASCGYITIDGIEKELRKQIILGNIKVAGEAE